MWGFWAGDHWIAHSAMWTADFKPTKQANAYRDLVYKKWWTNTERKANAQGEVRTRAFYGDYLVTVNGESKRVTLSKAQGSAEVAFGKSL